MAGQSSDHDPDQLRIEGARLRRRLADVAASIACTEDQVAETMERMALVLPYDATRLREHAARARHHSKVERDRAAALGLTS